MAKAATKTLVAQQPPQTKEITNWDEELAQAADRAAALEVTGGSWFSTRGGILALNDVAVPGNQLAAVVVSNVFENVFYDSAFDPDVQLPPKCFALGTEESKLAPHPSVVALDQQQHPACKGCEHNEFGSAVRANGARGKGKACSNRRRLALIPAGQLLGPNSFDAFTDEDHFAAAPLVGLKLPPTSVKGWGAYVNQLAGTVRRPPWAAFTKITLVPDPKTQLKLLFSPLGPVPDALVPLLKKRLDEGKAFLETPYKLEVEEAPAPAKAPKRGKY